MEGRTLGEVFGERLAAAVEPHYRAALAGGRRAFDAELDGAVYRTEVAPLRRGESIVGAVSVATDATARVAADRRLHDVVLELETIVTQAPIGLGLVDLEGRWLRVNNRFCEIVGYTRDELLALSFQDITHPDDLQQDLDNVRALLAGEIGSYGMEKRYLHKQGHVVWIWLAVGLIRDEEGNPRHFVAQIEDITARKRAEAYLVAERAVAAALAEVPTVDEAWIRVLEAIGASMDWGQGEAWLVDTESQQLLCVGTWGDDPAFESFNRDTLSRTFARGEGIPGRVWRDGRAQWVPAPADDPTIARRKSARATGIKSGVGLPLIGGGETIGTIGFFSRRSRAEDPEVLELMLRLGRQIGEFLVRRREEEARQKLELRLLEAQRNESLGVLAGGIAHDFNNLLVGVLGNASLLRDSLEPGSPLHAFAEEIELAATHAAGLTNQMLAYSGKGAFIVEAVDVSSVVAEAARLLRAGRPVDPCVELELDTSVPRAEGDRSQLGQLLLNLLTNAAEATSDGNGRVRVRTALVDADRDLLAGFRFGDQLAPGSYVRVDVDDHGCGMDENVLERMFDPFFSTKFTGRGLGLAASLGIVRAHNGAIRVISAPGAGTAISILLPSADSEHVALRYPASAAAGAGTVLIVDDEEIVRSFAESALDHFGYTTITAADGKVALDEFDRRANEIVCVLLDLTMPGLSGQEVLHALRDRDANVRVVLSSGYSPKTLDADGHVAFLQKPYSMDELRAAIAAAAA